MSNEDKDDRPEQEQVAKESETDVKRKRKRKRSRKKKKVKKTMVRIVWTVVQERCTLKEYPMMPPKRTWRSILDPHVPALRTFVCPVGKDSGKPRGYAHIDFDTVEDVRKALKLNRSELLGRYLKVDVAKDRRALNAVGPRPKGCKTIFVKNLPYDVTEDAVKKVFRIFGIVTYVRLPRWNHTGRLKGIGYVEFKREDSAEIAVKKRGDIHVGGRQVIIDYDDGDGPKQSFKTRDGRKWTKVNKKGGRSKRFKHGPTL